MLTNLLIAVISLIVASIIILNFSDLFEMSFRFCKRAMNFLRRMKLLISTLMRAYSRYQKFSDKTYLRGI